MRIEIIKQEDVNGAEEILSDIKLFQESEDFRGKTEICNNIVLMNDKTMRIYILDAEHYSLFKKLEQENYYQQLKKTAEDNLSKLNEVKE